HPEDDTDEDIMKEIVVADDDFVNTNRYEAMAADTSYQSKVLGGQNPLAMFCAGAEKIDLSNLSAYDQGCNEEFQHAMKNYFDGKASLDDALDLFYKGVWNALLEIPYGETRTYRQIAEKTGNPKACRAVGAANSRNPIWIMIPCHRVIGKDGGLTGYAGGLDKKSFLLDLERKNSGEK
ncbi:methylated-DNA-[protein]-cysteine S-methyltransferase, partial [human gut metagenome]